MKHVKLLSATGTLLLAALMGIFIYIFLFGTTAPFTGIQLGSDTINRIMMVLGFSGLAMIIAAAEEHIRLRLKAISDKLGIQYEE